jgi:hypothetical protein
MNRIRLSELGGNTLRVGKTTLNVETDLKKYLGADLEKHDGE